jgi:GNAT superfamily N-acetyltransferase
MRESDLGEVDRVLRLAFGTFLEMPDPSTFMADTAYAATRWHADPASAFVAVLDDRIAGSVYVTRWGSVGYFGPLTVRPDLWDRGVGRRLMEPVEALFESWGVRLAGLFTFATSAKHLTLYHRLGFRPRYLTAMMAKPVAPPSLSPPPARGPSTSWVSEEAEDPVRLLADCRELTGAVYDGLDVGREVRSVLRQGLGVCLSIAFGW